MARKEILILDDMIPDDAGGDLHGAEHSDEPDGARGAASAHDDSQPRAHTRKRFATCLRTVCFWALVVALVLFLNSIMGIGDDAYDNRGRIATFYKQPEDTIDVVFIGASSMYRGWSSMVAWNEYGITSYSYATSAQPTSAYKFIVKDIKKTQRPKVFVIDMRSYRSNPEPTDEYITGAVRKVSDNMPFSMNRIDAIDYMLDSIGIETGNGNIDYYFSFMLYHSRWADSKKDLMSIGARTRNKTQGTRVGEEIFEVHDFPVRKMSKPTDKKAPLPGNIEKNLTDLLDYLKETGDDATFLLLPCKATARDRKKFNTVESILDANGFPYLNMLDRTDEMGVDYSADFYDNKHFNVYGMDKSTRFLAEYLIQEYGLEDHRGDPRYANWDAAYEEYVSQMKAYIMEGNFAPPDSLKGAQ